MYLSILLPSIFVLYALYKKKLTLLGILLAWLFGFIIAYFGSYLAFSAVGITIILILFADKIKKGDKDTMRSHYSIISNLLMPTLSIIFWSITHNYNFYITYYVALAATLADTFSSGVGTLSKKGPFNFLTLKKLNTGEPGGISGIGIIASLVGGIIIGGIYLIEKIDFESFLLISLMGLIGSLIDSALAITLQAKYKCQVCKKIVETKRHCYKQAKYINGLKIINNDMVNLLANVIIFLISYLLLI